VHHRAQKLVILAHHRFDLFKSPVTLLSGHGSILSLVVSHSQLLTMTSLFAEPSGHYPPSGKSPVLRKAIAAAQRSQSAATLRSRRLASNAGQFKRSRFNLRDALTLRLTSPGDPPFSRSKWHYAKDILDPANLPLRRVIEKIGSIRNELMTIAKRERPRAPVCSWRSTISKVAQDSNDATVALDAMKHSLSVLNGISGVGNLRLRLAF
jgi:hypothetical protein